MNRGELQQVARIRLREAQVLLQANCWAGAYYLSGYAVECALKACIAKGVRRHDFPDRDLVNRSYTHSLVQLLQVARLDLALKAETAHNRRLAAHGEKVKDWSDQSRYEQHGEQAAWALYVAITHPSDGVLRWIRQSW